MDLHGTVTLPVIPLRGIAVLPGEIMHCDIGRKKTLSAMEQALSEEGLRPVCRTEKCEGSGRCAG